jgi:hypothetical protein
MKYLIFLVIVSLLCARLRAFGQAQPATPLTAEQLREEEAYTIGLQAYIYGFPLVEMYRLRYDSAFNPASSSRVPINQFRHRRALIDHTYTAVVSPNSDTIYSSAFLDLAPQPLILHVPDSKARYYGFQFLDFYTKHFASVGTCTGINKAGNFMITGPGWKGAAPNGVERIDAPTNAVLLIGRILVEQKEDLPAVHQFQDGCKLTPLSAWDQAGQKAAANSALNPPAYHRSPPLSFFEFMSIALRENPPPAREAVLLSQFARIGVGTDKSFQAEKLDPASARGLQRAMDIGKQMIARPPIDKGTQVNGWYFPPKGVGVFGDDYLLRAEVALKWLFALRPEEALYIIGAQDDRGMQLAGNHRYVLHFYKGQLPPVDAFWSITMYRLPERLLVANPIHRYSIGDRSKDLKYQPDGSLELYIQHDSPESDKLSNWLPAPAGDFNLILRAFMPRQELRDGTWKITAVKRLE